MWSFPIARSDRGVQPAEAVAEADALVSAVMAERGYPVSEEFDQRAADISVDHPVVVEHYREAHRISLRTTAGEAGTEDLRQAMVHFRALFDELLGREDREPTHATKETIRGVPSRTPMPWWPAS